MQIAAFPFPPSPFSLILPPISRSRYIFRRTTRRLCNIVSRKPSRFHVAASSPYPLPLHRADDEGGKETERKSWEVMPPRAAVRFLTDDVTSKRAPAVCSSLCLNGSKRNRYGWAHDAMMTLRSPPRVAVVKHLAQGREPIARNAIPLAKTSLRPIVSLVSQRWFSAFPPPLPILDFTKNIFETLLKVDYFRSKILSIISQLFQVCRNVLCASLTRRINLGGGYY